MTADPSAKRLAVTALLREHPDWPDRRVGREVGCDGKLVGAVRRELEQRGEIPSVSAFTRRGGKEPPPVAEALSTQEQADLRAARAVILREARGGNLRAAIFATERWGAPASQPAAAAASPAPRSPLADVLAQRRATKRRSA
jgi:hypothetical protein